MWGMGGNGWVYETFGISKRFLIKPLRCLLNVTPLKLALSAKCFIYRVVCWCLLFKVNSLQVNTNLIFYLNQSALTLIRSTNLFCFLWVGKSQTALKGGT